jgi:hypothetical protein
MANPSPTPHDPRPGGDSAAVAETPSVGLPSLTADSASELIPAAIRRVLGDGHHNGGARPSREVLNQQLCQRDPRRRVFAASASSFNVAVAVARFVWHLAGNSQLSAIAFYEPRANLFSDDGRVLPGSNSGARLLGEGADRDQICGIVARLRADASSRRGMAVIWRPDDAVRESRDIPCSLALACHLRGGELLTTVTMRSNNALRLLPYNLFEYTMLAELIAAELDVELGPYWHNVSSLHIFDSEAGVAEAVSSAPHPAGVVAAMPAIPRGKGALELATALTHSEAQLRTAVVAKDWPALREAIDRAKAQLHPYWLGLFSVLCLFATARAQATHEIDSEALLPSIPEALREPLFDLLD